MTTLRFLKQSSLAIALLFTLSTLTAQVKLIEERFAFEPELTYDKNIPSPAEVLGYRLGERFTEYAATVDYMRKLAAASDRITIGSYGETYEGRPLIYLVITSAENQGNIEEIRQNNLKLANPMATNATEAAAIMKDNPIVVSFSYNIHGNEASSTEAAKQVAYRLAAATDAATAEMLDELVFVMYPCINPDGRSRYVSWYNSMARDVVGFEPKDLEHFAPWPNGRTNHYWFDLNRDWIWGVHPESRGHTKIYQEWMPQVHTDYHEQGYNSNYFTMPGTTPRNKLLPDQYEALSDTFGMANIAAFDRHKIGYFTREAFDFYYPGYGSSYPSVMGAIGMLVEQGGIGGGRAIETSDGTILTIRQRLFDHYLTSIATLQKAVERKDILQKYTYDALNPKNAKDPTKAYILPNNDDDYLNQVVEILLRQGVKVDRADNSFSASNVRNYRDGKNATKTFPKGTYIVSCDQPRHLFINSILSPVMAIEDSVMYDMSTWAAPLAYNLDAYQSNRVLSVKTTQVTEAPTYKKGVDGVGATYAYTIDWKQQNAPKALALLWQKKYRVRSARKTFNDGKKEYSEGSLIVLLGRNLDKADKIKSDMIEIAEKANIFIDGHNTGRMSSGIDLVSNNTRPVKQPKVAMLVEPPFNTYTSGQLYFLFDQITALPVERIRTSMFQQTAVPKMGSRYGYANIHDYDVLILPGGGSRLKQLFGKDQIKEIRSWVSAGGVLIGTESAAHFLTKKSSGLTNVELIKAPKDSTEVAKFVPYADRRDYGGKKNIPGAAMNATLDTTNPLAFGMSKDLYSLKFGSDALKPNAGFQTVGRYAAYPNLLASGYANSANLKRESDDAECGDVGWRDVMYRRFQSPT